MVNEDIVRLGATGSLVGIFTQPKAVPDKLPAFLLLNAGLVHRAGPNRIYVKLARRLASSSFPVLRFDVSGLGDSEVRRDGLPYRESRIAETREVMDYLESSKGIEKFVLLGICSGADHAFRVACADTRAVGAVLIDWYSYPTAKYYFEHYRKRVFRLESWWNVVSGKHPVWRAVGGKLRGLLTSKSNGGGEHVERFLMDRPPREDAESRMKTLNERGVKQFFLYTAGGGTYYKYADQFRDMFPSVQPNRELRVDYWGDVDHTFTVLAHQDRLLGAVDEWARSFWPEQLVGGN